MQLSVRRPLCRDDTGHRIHEFALRKFRARRANAPPPRFLRITVTRENLEKSERGEEKLGKFFDELFDGYRDNFLSSFAFS